MFVGYLWSLIQKAYGCVSQAPYDQVIMKKATQDQNASMDALYVKNTKQYP